MWYFLGAAVLLALLEFSSSVPLDGGETCMEQACVVRAGRLLNAMNTEADPCVNFAEYACGGTFQAERNLGLDESYGMASRESVLIWADLNRLFLNEKHKWSPQAPETKALMFYEQCKSTWFTRSHAFQLLDQMAHALGVPELYQGSLPSGEPLVPPPTSYGAALRVLREQFGVNLSPNLMRMTVDGKCLHVISFIELIDYGSNKDLATLNFFQSKYEAAQLDSFKTSYSELHSRAECIKSKENKYQDMSLAQLINEAPTFGWPDFLNQYDNSSMVEASPCIPELSRLLAALYDEYPLLTKKFLISLAMKNLWTRKDADDMDSGCYALTERYFVEVLTSIVKNPKSMPDSKPVARMGEQMRRVLEERMLNATWLDEETRAVFLEKLRTLRLNVGYPTVVDDKEALYEFYSTLELSGTLPKDLMRVARWREQISSDRCDVEFCDQELKPLDITAFNNQYLQSIAISLGQMRSDGYDKRLPSSMNYAGVGMSLGHEIMHTFDDTQRYYDRWLEQFTIGDATDEYLREGETCLNEYYNTAEVNGVATNGKEKLSENIADVFGLQLAYEAWQQELEDAGPDPKLPGVTYTPEQIFFIAYGQANCEEPYKDSLLGQFVTGYSRVHGAVAQSPEFAAAFNCPAQNMPKRCKLWDAV